MAQNIEFMIMCWHGILLNILYTVQVLYQVIQVYKKNGLNL